MTLVVETGSGTPGANGYTSVAFVDAYLSDRARSEENEWNIQSVDRRGQAIVAATDYIDRRWGPQFMGVRARSVIDGRAASGLVTIPSLPLANELLVVGIKTYRLVSTLAQENDVLIGATAADTITNLIAAINLDGAQLDVTVQEDTRVNDEALALLDTSGGLGILARTEGVNGNLIILSTTITAATATGSGFLVGGLDEGPQPLEFPRSGLFDRSGRSVNGIPLKLRQATAEYAVRALAAALAPDPESNSRLQPVTSFREKVGPIEEETTYAEGGQPVITVPYPDADRLLAEYVTAAGGVIRA